MKFLNLLHPTQAEREWLTAECLRRAANLYEQSGHWRKADECREEAGEAAQAAGIYLEHQDHAHAAPLLLQEGRYEEALNCYRQWEQSLPEHETVGQVRARLGIAACLKLLHRESNIARETYHHARSQIEAADIYLRTVNPEAESLGYGMRHPERSRRAGDIWEDPLTGMEFVWIPEGRFTMGSPETEEGRYDREGPQHDVSVEGFWLAKTPVTNAQYRTWKTDHDSQEYEGHSLNDDEQPAVYVSWEDAKEFISWLNEQHGGTFTFRLPSEAEWEYACRAGTTTALFWGDNPDEAEGYANVADKTKQKEWSNWTVHNL